MWGDEQESSHLQLLWDPEDAAESPPVPVPALGQSRWGWSCTWTEVTVQQRSLEGSWELQFPFTASQGQGEAAGPSWHIHPRMALV